jgi:lipoprotein NlpD
MIRIAVALLPVVLLSGCFSQPPVPSVDRSSSQSRAAAPVAGPGQYLVKRGETLYRIALEHGLDYRDLAAWNNIVTPSSLREGQILRLTAPGGEVTAGTVTTPVGGGAVVEARPLDSTASPVSQQPPVVTINSGALKREPKVGKEPYSEEAYARLNRVGGADTKPDAKPATKPEVAAPAAPAPAASSAPSGPDEVAWQWPSAAKVAAPYNDSSNKGLDFSGKAGDPVLAAGDGKVVYAGSGLRGYGELVIIKHNPTYLSAYAHNRKILVKEGQQVTRGQKIAEMGNTDADSIKLHFEIRRQGKPVDPTQYLPKR